MIKEYLDREKHVDPDLKWKHFKKKLKNDERYELIESSSERERLFEKTLEEYLVERRKGKY
jgi:FF domain.